MNTLRDWKWLLLFWLIGSTPPVVWGSGDFLPLDEPECYGGLPKKASFTAATSAWHTYSFSGKCGLLHTRLHLQTFAPWTGTGTYNPATGQTTEDVVVPAARLDEPSRPYGRFQTTMHCASDPWLTIKIKCTRIVPTVDAPLDRPGAANASGWRQAMPLAPMITDTIQRYSRPFTSILTDDTRRALNQQYRLVFQTKVNPLVRKPNAPNIIYPQPNTRITSSSFKIQIVPSQMLTGTHIFVQFTRLDGPPNTLKPTYAWTRPTSELVNSTYLPTDIVNSKGNWSLRARIEAPKPGDFSADVPFVYAPAIATKPRGGFDIYRR